MWSSCRGRGHQGGVTDSSSSGGRSNGRGERAHDYDKALSRDISVIASVTRLTAETQQREVASLLRGCPIDADPNGGEAW